MLFIIKLVNLKCSHQIWPDYINKLIIKTYFNEEDKKQNFNCLSCYVKQI